MTEVLQLRLFELAEAANREHAAALRAGSEFLAHVHACGSALIEAKSLVAHGEWLPWLEQNFEGSIRNGQHYMRFVANTKAPSYLDEGSLEGALKRLSRNQSVEYHHQLGIAASGGSVPLQGTSHLYRVTKLLWPEAVEEVLVGLLVGRSAHVCCGASRLGDVRIDQDARHEPDMVADAASLPLEDLSFDTVLCDPPYNGEHQWNHDVLTELARVASKRIVFQHWFVPAAPDGRYRKTGRFWLSDLYVWQPRTYFGRAQLVSVFDAR